MKKTNIRERGSAVILALALLSLMMILIMSFVTNALLDSRVAETKKQLHNVQNISDMALNRALMSLKYCVANNINTPYPIDRFNNFVSWVEDTQLPSPLNSNNPTNDDGYIEVHSTSHSDTETAALKRSYGGLKGAMDTKLFPNSDDIFLYRYPTNRNADDDANETWVANAGRSFIEQPRWVYLQDDNNNDIGRFAYAVLPDKGQVNAAMIMDSPATLPERKGKSIDFDITNLLNNEYDFFNSTPTDFESINGLKLSQKSGVTVIDDQLRTLTDSSKLIDTAMFVGELANGDFNNNSDKNKDINALYQKMTFNLAGYPSDRQSADGTGRINLNDQTFWNNTVTNIQATVPYLSTILAANNYFADDNTFRNQVTANMKDFLDENDDISSDVAAGSWTLNTAPAYTGNEKTPYISEFALNLRAAPEMNGTETKINLTLNPQIKLVDLYGSNIATQLQFKIDSVKGKFKVTKYQATFNVPYNYKDINDDTQMGTASIAINLDDDSVPVALHFDLKNASDENIIEFNLPSDGEYNSTTFADLNSPKSKTWTEKNSGSTDKITYYQNAISFNDTTVNEATLSTDTAVWTDTYVIDKIKEAFNLWTPPAGQSAPELESSFTPTLKSIDKILQIDSVCEVKMGNMLLTDTTNSTNIDYVNFNANEITQNPNPDVAGDLTALSFLTNSGTDDSGTYTMCLAHIDADPRANLNAKDWERRTETGNGAVNLSTNSNTANFENMLKSMKYLGIVERFNNPDVSNTPIKFSTLAGISRGEAWKTLNIIKATTAANPTFADGDAKILDQLDIETANNNPLSDSFYKVNANTASPDIWKGLLTDLKFYDANAIGGVSINPDEAIFDGTFDEDHLILGNSGITGIVGNLVSNKNNPVWQLRNRGDVLRVITETWNELYSSDKLYGDDNNISIENLDNDRKKRLFGLVDNLIPIVRVEKFPEEFQILIVAQSLNPNSLAADVVDKITAEEKILVTVRRDGNNFTIIKKEKMLY